MQEFWNVSAVFTLGVLAGLAVQAVWQFIANALIERRRVQDFAWELKAALPQIANLGAINKRLIEALGSSGDLQSFTEFFPLANVHCPAGERLYAEGLMYRLLPHNQVFELRRMARFYTEANEQYVRQFLSANRSAATPDLTAARELYRALDVAFSNDPPHIEASIKGLKRMAERGIAVYLLIRGLAALWELFRAPTPPQPAP